MKKTILLIFAVSYIISVYSQNKNNVISGHYENIEFRDFVEEIERNTEFTFFYKYEDIDSIYINASGDNMSIDSILRNCLSKYSLRHYKDLYGNVIVYRGSMILETLPNFSQISNEEIYDNKNDVDESVVEIEQAEKIVVAEELINVGNKQSAIVGRTNYIRGRITEESTGEPVVSATIYVEELKTGAVTDLDGYFSLPVKTGEYRVKVNSLSMQEKKFYLHVYTDGNISIKLEKEVVSLNEIKITADRNDNVKGIQMGFSRMSSKTIKEIPVVMGERDLLKIAQMLPGVQSSGEGSSGINVRGGTADQNLFYINKVPIYNTSHLFGFFTAFSPDIVSDFSLYKSNIPAKYGGRVSSIFEISTRQGNNKEFFCKGGVSPITGHIAAEGPIVKDKSSFVVSYRGTYSDWILSKVSDEDLRNSSASFYDLSTNFNTKINDNNNIKIFGYYSSDQFSLSKKDDYDYSNIGGSVAWKHFFSPKLNGDISLVMSQYGFGHNNKENLSSAYRQEYKLNHNELKVDMLYLLSNNHRISFGGSGILYNLDRGDLLKYGEESNWNPISLGKEKGIESALYVSDEFTVLSRLTFLLGLRASNFLFMGPQNINLYHSNSSYEENNIKGEKNFGNNEIIKPYYSIEPRLAMNLSLGANSSLKASYNRSSQYIFMLSNTVAISPTDQWKLSDYYIKPPVGDQLSLGYYHNFLEKGIETSLEVYGKRTDNIVEYRDGSDFVSGKPAEMSLLQGVQEGYGIEFMAKKKTGKVTGWIAYTYSKSVVTVDSDISSEQINYGKSYPSNYDKPHGANLVANFRITRRVSFSTNVVYSTGRPVTYPISSYNSEGQNLVAYSGRNEYRIPDYFRVDCSVNLEGNLNKKKVMHSYWMLNVYNITGRKNAYSVYFEQKEDGTIQGYKLSVFGQPVITLSWNFKFGNYVSE